MRKKNCDYPGPKRLKDKNIKELLGKLLIAYTIEAAPQSDAFDEVFVFTDSQKYADIAMQYGADARFLRSEQTAADLSGSWDVVREGLTRFRAAGTEYVCKYSFMSTI